MPKNTRSMKNSAKKNSEQVKREIVLKFENTEYGKVTKLMGECNFMVKCFDKIERMCHLRKGIKKDERVLLNSLVLIGLRDYQETKGDIIYVYNRQQELELKKMGEVDIEEEKCEFFGDEKSDNVVFDFNEI